MKKFTKYKKLFEEYKNRCEEIINFYPTRRQTLLRKRGPPKSFYATFSVSIKGRDEANPILKNTNT